MAIGNDFLSFNNYKGLKDKNVLLVVLINIQRVESVIWDWEVISISENQKNYI